MMSKSFDLALKKGEIGEQVCRQRLEQKGWVVYRPVTDGAHAFDMMAIKDKSKAIAIDVKAKARMNHWRATGIDQRHFDVYSAFSDKHQMPFWIFFVDEYEQKIYGNEISKLEEPRHIDGNLWPKVMVFRNKQTRLWHLDSMILLCEIDDQIARQLAEASQRSYAYDPI